MGYRLRLRRSCSTHADNRLCEVEQGSREQIRLSWRIFEILTACSFSNRAQQRACVLFFLLQAHPLTMMKRFLNPHALSNQFEIVSRSQCFRDEELDDAQIQPDLHEALSKLETQVLSAFEIVDTPGPKKRRKLSHSDKQESVDEKPAGM